LKSLQLEKRDADQRTAPTNATAQAAMRPERPNPAENKVLAAELAFCLALAFVAVILCCIDRSMYRKPKVVLWTSISTTKTTETIVTVSTQQMKINTRT
jgi:hypothetical protein